jgi:hypothetical protein
MVRMATGASSHGPEGPPQTQSATVMLEGVELKARRILAESHRQLLGAHPC